MTTKRPDNLPRGWLAETLRERTVKAKITDPEEKHRVITRATSRLKLGPGANTVQRRGRQY
jgi:hypothetical protein